MLNKFAFHLFLLFACAACTLQLHPLMETAETDLPEVSQAVGSMTPVAMHTLKTLPTLSSTPSHAPTSTPIVLPSPTATLDNFQRIHFDERLWTHFTDKNGLPTNVVLSIAFAPDQSLWLGNSGGYISHFDGEAWESYSLPTDWEENYVRCVFVSRTGDVWVGTDGNGAFRFDGKEWVHYSEKEGLTDSRVYSFMDAPDGSIWVGAEMNLYSFDGNTWKSYRSNESPLIGLREVLDIESTPDGVFWFATGGGLYSFDGENWKYYSMLHMEHGGITDIAVAQDETLWIAQPLGGIYHFFSDGRKESFGVPGLGKERYISSIAVSNDGSVWVSSFEKNNNVLRRWDGKNWIIYDQLPFDEVWDMEISPDGSLWFATYEGAFRFTPEE
jgi:ligand-binding sensor domain-containing protein